MGTNVHSAPPTRSRAPHPSSLFLGVQLGDGAGLVDAAQVVNVFLAPGLEPVLWGDQYGGGV